MNTLNLMFLYPIKNYVNCIKYKIRPVYIKFANKANGKNNIRDTVYITSPHNFKFTNELVSALKFMINL